MVTRASDRCIDEKRKTITGDDILYALSTLGFDSYVSPLQLYLRKYRDVSHSIPVLCPVPLCADSTSRGIKWCCKMSRTLLPMTPWLQSTTTLMLGLGFMSSTGLVQGVAQTLSPSESPLNARGISQYSTQLVPTACAASVYCYHPLPPQPPHMTLLTPTNFTSNFKIYTQPHPSTNIIITLLHQLVSINAPEGSTPSSLEGLSCVW